MRIRSKGDAHAPELLFFASIEAVVDGGTLDCLHGIDAPESAQLCQDAGEKPYRCGQVVALVPFDRIGEATGSCKPRDTDRYGRTVAVCRKGAEDLNG